MDDTLDSTEDSLDELVLETTDLPLGASIGTSSEPALDFTGLDMCYDSKLKVLSNETTLVLSNIRELNRVPKTK